MNDLVSTGSGPLLLRVQRLVRGTATYKDQLVLKHEEILEMAKILRGMGCVIAYTEGVWDLLHRGHCAYIAKGKEDTASLFPQAEKVIMVVGVDSDKLTKERKGPTRPAIPEDERCEMLGYMRGIVDIITVLHEPEVFNRRLHPEVRIISESTGDNPDLEDMKRYCKQLVCLPPQRPTGTTAIIRKFAIEGGMAAITSARQKVASAIQEAVAAQRKIETALEEAVNELRQ